MKLQKNNKNFSLKQADVKNDLFFIFNLRVYMYVHVFMCLSCVFRFFWGQKCVKDPLEQYSKNYNENEIFMCLYYVCMFACACAHTHTGMHAFVQHSHVNASWCHSIAFCLISGKKGLTKPEGGQTGFQASPRDPLISASPALEF